MERTKLGKPGAATESEADMHPFVLDMRTLGLEILTLTPAAWVVLGWKRPARRIGLVVLSAITLAAPWAVDAEGRLARFITAIAGLTYALKVYDLDHVVERVGRPAFGPYLRYMLSILSLVYLRQNEEARRPWPAELRRFLATGAGFLGGCVLFGLLFRIDWAAWPFVIEHTVKVSTLFLMVICPGAAALGSLYRLTVGPGREFMRAPYAARTPADFWRRYNRPTSQFFHEYLFVPLGGRHHPLRGALAAFLLSALVHEYVFLPPVGRVEGYQTAFFLVQCLASLVTLGVRPRGLATPLGIAATQLFNLATSVWFFASMGHVVELYAARS